MPLLTGHQITARRVAGDDHSTIVTVSVADAAKLAEVSVDTIRRRIRAGEFKKAWRDHDHESSPWNIPVHDLIDAGMCPASVLDELDERLDPDLHRLANQIIDLKAELSTERTKLETTERLLAHASSEVSYLRGLVDQMLATSAHAISLSRTA